MSTPAITSETDSTGRRIFAVDGERLGFRDSVLRDLRVRAEAQSHDRIRARGIVVRALRDHTDTGLRRAARLADHLLDDWGIPA